MFKRINKKLEKETNLQKNIKKNEQCTYWEKDKLFKSLKKGRISRDTFLKKEEEEYRKFCRMANQ